MLNTNTNISFNAPATGILQKSNENSFFIQCHHNSTTAENIFKDNPEYKQNAVVVLQVLLGHSEKYLIELLPDNAS